MVKKWMTHISQVARCICLPATPGISGLRLATFQVPLHNHNSVEMCFPSVPLT